MARTKQTARKSKSEPDAKSKPESKSEPAAISKPVSDSESDSISSIVHGKRTRSGTIIKPTLVVRLVSMMVDNPHLQYFDIVIMLPYHEHRERFLYDERTQLTYMERYHSSILQYSGIAPLWTESALWFEKHGYNTSITLDENLRRFRKNVLKRYQDNYSRESVLKPYQDKKISKYEFVLDQTIPYEQNGRRRRRTPC